MEPRRLEQHGISIHLTLTGLVWLCATLLAVSAGTILFVRSGTENVAARSSSHATARSSAKSQPWGEISACDLEIEQPEEYVAFEDTSNRVAKWHFAGMTLAQIAATLNNCGPTEAEIAQALSPAKLKVTDTEIEVRPDDEMVLSLSPEGRTKLYTFLAKNEANHFMRCPYYIPDTIENHFRASGLNKDIINLIKKLVYTRSRHQYFSDIETALHRIPLEADRLKLLKALSRAPVVLPEIRIRPETDIDLVLSYWGWAPTVRLKDARPLLEGLQRLPDGGSVSLSYLLPAFARERLFTSSLPAKLEKDPSANCHWTTMNFFNAVPDDRFFDGAYVSSYVQDNYYQVARPRCYGDLILILDDDRNAIHSAIYLADDMVFTKNGSNFAQPWTIMRLENLLALYSITEQPKLLIYRMKST